MLSGSDALAGIIKKLLTIGFFVFVIQNYDSLLRAVIEGFIQTGKIASSGSHDAFASVRDPSSIVDAGFFAALPGLDHIRNYSSLGALKNMGDILITGICSLGILLSYFIIAIQVFVTYLEFGMVSTLGLMLIPFGVFKHTSFLAEKLFGAIIAFGIKLMVLGFLVSVTMPVLRQLEVPPDPTWTQLFNMLVVCMANAALAWHAPGVAAGLLAGGPSLTAATAGSSVAAGAMGFQSGALLSGMAARSPSQAIRASSQIASASAVVPGIATGGFQVASANAGLRGKGTIGTAIRGVGGAATALFSSSVKAGASPAIKVAQGFRSGFETGRDQVPGASVIRKDSTSKSRIQSQDPGQSTAKKTATSEETKKASPTSDQSQEKSSKKAEQKI